MPDCIPPFVAFTSPLTGQTVLLASEDVIVAYERLVAALNEEPPCTPSSSTSP